MAVTTTGNHLRINDVDTNANVIANDGTAKHGRIYLSNGSGYEIYIGNHDGSLSKLTAKATSTSVWGVSTTGYHDNIQATTDGHVLRRSGGVLGFGTITSSSISDVGTIVQGSGITLTGTLTNRLVGSGNLTIDHADTSSFSKSSLTGATVISNLTVDTYGHITDWTTRNLQISDIISIPNREVVFGTGSGVGSHSGFKYTTLGSVQIGTGTATGTYSFQMGAGSVASYYTMNIGGGIVNNRGNYSLIISESGSEISGSGNANLSVLLGGNYNKIIASTDAYGNVIMGDTNTVTSTTKQTTYNRILGSYNTITDALKSNILGFSNNITASGAYSAYDNDIIGYDNSISTSSTNAGYNKIIGTTNTITGGAYNNIIGRYCNNGGFTGVMLLSDGGSSTLTATAHHQFSARFIGGYRFMKDGSTQWMAIASSGYVTINNIPDASSATDILVSNSNVISKRTLNPIAFNGLAIPNQQIVFGTGTGISSSVGLKYNGTYLEVNNSTSQGVTQINSSNIIVGSNHSAGTYNSYLRLNSTQSGTRGAGISIYNSASQDHWWLGTTYYSGNFHLRTGNGNDGEIWGACRDDGSATTNSVFFIPRTTTEFHVSNTLTVHNIPTAASATDILVSNGGVVSTRSLSSLNIPTALWSDSGGYIEPLSNSWIQLKPVVGKGSVRLSSDNDSGIIEVFNDDSSQTLTIKSDSNDDVSYNIKTGKTHKFNEKISIGYIPTNTTSTSYLVDNSGVIEKRSLPIASSSTLGVIKIGDTLQIDGNGVINTYLQDDFVYDFRSTDLTNSFNLTPVEAMSIPLSVGLWEVNIVAGYKFETTSTGARLSLNYSEPGFTMHGKLAATINSNDNSEITSKTADSMDISSVNTANSEYALTGKIIIRTTTAGDLSLNFLSLTNGSTVTIMKYSAMTARKLNTHAP